ncbi:MAG: DNA cytosine methyltransferase [Verrucomicrobiota bacterium]|nr:DNA cytosine methyltransferase [Verrucomicrobiota bacterium]
MNLNYKLTLKKLREYILNNISELASLDEFNAILTHWVEMREHKYPFIKPEWFYILQKFDFINQTKDIKGESKNSISEPIAPYQASFDFFYDDIPFPPPKKWSFKFIDLFAGIGGFRLAFQKNGGKCVFSSEWDKNAKKTYETNFGEVPYGDITKIDHKDIPDHDILCAGFPCQAFSIAGQRKGFYDEKGRGNLFFDVLRILKEKQPKAFLLENVKNLEGHDKGKTFQRIKKELEDLNYYFEYKILNSCEYGNVPQNRERIYIVGFKTKNHKNKFIWPTKEKNTKSIRDVLEKNVNEQYYYKKYPCYKELLKSVKSIDTVYQWRRIYVRENKNSLCPTLTANMGTGGHNVPIILDGKKKNSQIGNIRKLTPLECARIQGYPDNYVLPNLANAALYKQFGNSVTVPVISKIARSIKKALEG